MPSAPSTPKLGCVFWRGGGTGEATLRELGRRDPLSPDTADAQDPALRRALPGTGKQLHRDPPGSPALFWATHPGLHRVPVTGSPAHGVSGKTGNPPPPNLARPARSARG